MKKKFAMYFSSKKNTESEEAFFLNGKSSLPVLKPKNQNVFEPTKKADKGKYQFVVDWQLT